MKAKIKSTGKIGNLLWYDCDTGEARIEIWQFMCWSVRTYKENEYEILW